MNFEYDPAELAKVAEEMKPYATEAMRLAAMMKMARDANAKGDRAMAQMYAFTVTTIMNMKSPEELMKLCAAAINNLSGLAEQLTDTLAEGLADAIEQMLKDGKL